ncbi:MAG: mannosylglycerate synthase domain-containing protein [Acidimicrobiia bacterium]
MSLVVFPFKREDPELLVRNAHIAAAHSRVAEVLGVGFEEEATFRSLAAEAPGIEQATGKKVGVIVQERIGTKRPGKGDGMNTALRYFLESTDHERIHFYDADITSFSQEWITKAEEAADHDYHVVKHYFPRATTDAMITWMITRCGFAILWPRSGLPWIEQPLGGELLFKRAAVERFVSDDRVQAQSDWGIDTLYTFATVSHGLGLFEAYIPQGKQHRLYGALTDVKTMLVECFAAIQSLRHETLPFVNLHRVDYPDVVPEQIAEKVGYDIETTIRLPAEGWTPRQEELLKSFPEPVRKGMLECRTWPRFGFMDEENWYGTYEVLLEEFTLGDEDWEELLFKLWVARVLRYTMQAVTRGYSYAMRYLRFMVTRYIRRSALEQT